MKTGLKLAAALLLIVLLNHRSIDCLAQGSLFPPGTPAPTMKTLDQVKAGIAIGTAPYTINNPGNYFLTTNLAVTSGSAITINTNGVTLDLNGFSISSTSDPATGDGIHINETFSEIAIFNGFVRGRVFIDGGGIYRGPGFYNGIFCAGFPLRVRVQGVSITGCQQNGINLGGAGNYTLVRDCAVYVAGGNGIAATTVTDCTVEYAGMSGISAVTVNNSTYDDTHGSTLGAATGIAAATVNNCVSAVSGSGKGIYAYSVANSYGGSASGTGIEALSGALNCYGASSSGYGLRAWRTAETCSGVSTSSEGIHGDGVLQNCNGQSGTGYGINCLGAVTGCYATSPGGTGLQAATANDCYGAGGLNGLIATNALNSSGVCTATNSGGLGLNAKTALNCYGQSGGGAGLSALSAENCYGSHPGTNSAAGLYGQIVAIGCAGDTTGSGSGLDAFIANSCGAGTATHKYNMP